MIAAVIVLVALPIIDVSLAFSPAESPSLSAQTADMVNAYNDLLRSPGSPCTEYAAFAPMAPIAEEAP